MDIENLFDVQDNLYVVYYQFENGEAGHVITNDEEEAELMGEQYIKSMSNKMGSSTIVDTKVVEYERVGGNE